MLSKTTWLCPDLAARSIGRVIGLIAWIVTAALVAEWFWALAGTGVAAWFFWRMRRIYLRAERDLEAVAAEYVELATRCEVQNRWALAGNERGIYGEYPPAKLDGTEHPAAASTSVWTSTRN